MLYLVRSDRKVYPWKGEPVPEVMWLKAVKGCFVFTPDRAQAMRMTEEAAKKLVNSYNSKIRKTDFGSARLSAEPDSIME